MRTIALLVAIKYYKAPSGLMNSDGFMYWYWQHNLYVFILFWRLSFTWEGQLHKGYPPPFAGINILDML